MARASTWAGTTLDDRRAARRERLLGAGLDLLGTGGSATVSVRAVCRAAKLTERYFYENFTDRENLVLTVYERVADQARRAVADAVPDPSRPARERAQAAVSTFVELMVDDPRKGRVLLVAPISDPALSARGIALLPTFAALIREHLPRRMDSVEKTLTATSLVGALANLFTSYLGGALRVPRDRLVSHCVELLTSGVSAP